MRDGDALGRRQTQHGMRRLAPPVTAPPPKPAGRRLIPDLDADEETAPGRRAMPEPDEDDIPTEVLFAAGLPEQREPAPVTGEPVPEAFPPDDTVCQLADPASDEQFDVPPAATAAPRDRVRGTSWTRAQAVVAAAGLVLLVLGAGLIFTGAVALFSARTAPITVGELVTVAGWMAVAAATAVWHTTMHRLLAGHEALTVTGFTIIVALLVAIGLPFTAVVVFVSADVALASGLLCLTGFAAAGLVLGKLARRRRSAAPTPDSQDGFPRRGLAE